MLNILEIHQYDVVNGPGVRCSIWLAGCSQHCKGCWSPHTWDPTKGHKYTKEEILKYINNSRIDGISILGGDPLYWVFKDKPNEVIELFKLCHNSGKPVWVWSGYTFEKIQEKYPEILEYIDVLIDGPFIEEQKDLNLYWRGSKNQRIISISKDEKN